MSELRGDTTGDEPRSQDEWDAEKRAFVLDEREHIMNLREQTADERDRLADAREDKLDARDGLAPASHDEEWSGRQVAARSRGEARRLALAAVEVARNELSRSTRVPPLVSQFAVMAKHLHGSESMEECLSDIVAFTHRMMARSSDVSLSSLENSVLRTRAATSELARLVDEMQADTSSGPSSRALHRDSGGAVISGNVDTDDRWPEFGPLALEVGVLSALTVCIHLEREPARVLGTLNQYATEYDAFTEVDKEVAIVLAAHAAVAISSIRQAGQPSVSSAQDPHDVIAAAKAVLMQRGGMTADEAFDALRGASQLLADQLDAITAP